MVKRGNEKVMATSRIVIGVGAVVVWLAAMSGGARWASAQGPGMMHGRMMGTLPQRMEKEVASEAKIQLGRMLFYDGRLSADAKVSCNSCHDLERYGVDGLAVSLGHKGQKGTRNSPSVYHAAGHVAQFWDARAANVEEQAKGPVLNPVEMAMESGDAVARRLQAIPGYAKYFSAAFPGQKDPITFENMAIAIGAFERGLVTPSRWDRFLKGERGAITQQEMRGHHEFMHNGCASCHNGAYVGGASLQKVGREKAWPTQDDPGRMALSGLETDRMVFKVPSLRNVEKTAPYFHNGKVASLEEAVQLMGRHQLGIELQEGQTHDIVGWLKSLTGVIPKDYIARPELP
jgi:cytochrome c peroxidase